MSHYTDLKNLLSFRLLTAPYDGQANIPETHAIDHLITVLREWEMGGMEDEELTANFDHAQIPNFDLWDWVRQMEEQGVYS